MLESEVGRALAICEVIDDVEDVSLVFVFVLAQEATDGLEELDTRLHWVAYDHVVQLLD